MTNGVHLGTWLEPALTQLLRDAGIDPAAPPAETPWDKARDLDDDALWRVHAAAKTRLARLTHLDPERLTIGFARRFATYKRAGLIFSDLERLLALPGADRRRRQGAPAGQPGQGRDAADHRARARALRPDRLPRRLRHRARADDHPRLRRLAEQPDPPARGLRHLRHEGRRERRAQPLGARRLVARGLLARGRLGDRRRLRRSRPRTALPAARDPGRADCGRAARTGCG